MRSAELDSDVIAFLADCGRRTADEFGKEPGEPPLLEWGDCIQFQAITPTGRSRIVIVREGTDWWRIRYQVAHEAFHWICTPPQTFHWAHELFAVEMAVRAMDEIGEHDYASRAADLLREQAELLTVDAMLLTPGYPDGLYGRAWLTGRQLADAVGWERLKLLAGSFDENGKVDVAAWAGSIPTGDRARAEAVLGPTSPEWV